MPTATTSDSSQRPERRSSGRRSGEREARGNGTTAERQARGDGISSGGDSAGRWPLERILFLMAGTMTGLSAVLSAVVSPWFLLLTGFVAINQLAFAAIGNCPSSWVLQRYLGVERATCR